MKIIILALLLVSSAFAGRCYIPSPGVQEKIINPLVNKPITELPANFTWQNISGYNMLTLTRNQNTPRYCDACWAFAATSALSDRIKIARNASWPEINLSPQNLLSCDHNSKGCEGGDPLSAYEHIYNSMTVDETCANYEGLGWTTGRNCSQFNICGSCGLHNKCRLPKTYFVYTVTEYGNVTGEEAMMNEIYQRGPIVCNINSTTLKDYKSGILDGPNTTDVDYSIEVVGWGVNNNKPYWIARNSWGSFWGNEGFFNISRGHNALGIESACSWAVPNDTWTDGVKNTSKSHASEQSPDVLIQEQVKVSPRMFLPEELKKETDEYEYQFEDNYIPDPEIDRHFDPSKTPFSHIKEADLPASWDWRNVDGVNYITWTKNQHLPRYCGSCWAESVTSILADRIMIASQGKRLTLGLSPQALINCEMGGSCGGGDPLKAFKMIRKHGLGEESCHAYVGHREGKSSTCESWQLCEVCLPGYQNNNGTCVGVNSYKKWNVTGAGIVREMVQMKKAILHGGPIICGIYSTSKLGQYESGVFTEFTLFAKANHFVSVVGWGETEDGAAYWIVRNSWGTYWGEWGFFRILMGNENLGIENECFYAYPVMK